ncbi:MAG: hypothetical protein LBJ61_09400 [Deltaproteobacteria bacterium]|nr:hypothetical protein [Deltaproteobacteria bacterium]
MIDDFIPEPPSPDEHPQARSWLWVLTYPVTVNRDNMLILEGDGGDYIPIFKERAEAENFLEKVGGKELYYQVQAMHLFDARKFAREKSLDLVTLTGIGQVLERWDHKSAPDDSLAAGDDQSGKN